jgi:gas vesicle protein
MYSEDNTSKAMWFVAGAALGATLALLFAPASGRVTRRQLRRRVEHGADVISDSSQEILQKGKDLYEKGRQMADDAAELIERGRKMVEG